jgi:hypothetical protein
MTAVFSQTGHRYRLILRGECGPLTEGLSGDAAIDSGHGCTSLIFSARDDSELYGLLDRIQDLALHLISIYQIDGTQAVPHLPLRASLAHPGAFPLYGRGTLPPPRGVPRSCHTPPGRRARNAGASRRVTQPLSRRVSRARRPGSGAGAP